MFHVLTFENGQINKITAVTDEAIAAMISKDFENCAYFDDEDEKANEKLIVWLQLRGLSREEANRVIARRISEKIGYKKDRRRTPGILVDGRQAIPIVADSLPEALAQVLDRISQIKEKQSTSPPDLSGVIDRFGHRISREACGACFVCGETAIMHKECMEPGGTKCCPSAMCEACGASMAAADTAARMAERYRTGPINIVGTLSNLFVRITDSGDTEEFSDWSAGVLYGSPSLDIRLANPEYRPVMAALANALRDRAEIVEKMLRKAGKESGR